MSGFTIRARLTMAIFVLTGVILSIGLWLGMGLLENQVRDAAIDERAELFDSPSINGIDGFGGLDRIDGLPEGIFFDPEIIEGIFSDLFGSELITQSAGEDFDAVFVREVVEESGVEQKIVNEFATSEGDLHVLLERGRIARLGEDGSAAVVETVDTDIAVVPIADIFDLNSAAFDPFDQFGGGADEPLTLAFARRAIGGSTIGFVADVTDGLDALVQVRNTMAGAVIVLTLLAGVATWFIAGRALRPVGAITAQVSEISTGTLSDRVPEPNATDEIGVLARTMNTMLGRLENTDLRRRQFVSDASHELRTPVAVLRSEAEVAKRAPGSTTIDEFAEVVLTESNRLERLVEDLLALARGDEARLMTSLATIDVDEVVLAEAARMRSIPIDLGAVSAGRVVGHEDEMTRVIAHLLDNAARHAQSSVAVGVQTVKDTVRIWVDDDGPGISESERERIFERFIRLDDARTRDTGGAGLGLAVVHSTVEKMGGTIAVFDSPRGGARFQIDLPAA